MKFATASALTDLLMRHTAEQNEILKTVQIDEPHEEFIKIRNMFGRTMASIYSDALYPILEEHPTLKPDRLR